MKFAFLTESQYQGKVPPNHSNMRTEMAWQAALQSDHFNLFQYEQVKNYDVVFVIFPKALVKLNMMGVEMDYTHSQRDYDNIKIYSLPVTEILKKHNKKVCYIQEGPTYVFNDYNLPAQFNFYNQLAECDIIFAHNEYDIHFYKGLFPSTKVSVIPTLMYNTNLPSFRTPENKAIIGGNFCFPGESKVLMSSGELKNIENITVGERVLVGGKSYPILHKFNRNIDEDIIIIETYGNRKLKCTSNHKLNGIIRKKHILWNGKRQQPINRKDISNAPIEELPANSLSKGDFLLVPKSALSTVGRYDDDLMWLFGFWLAEGSVESRPDRREGAGLGRIQFSIHKSENFYAEKIKSILKKYYNIEKFSDRINKGTNSRIISCSNQSLALYLVTTFGMGALNKKIPIEFYWYSNINILIRALFSGDGCFYRTKSKSSSYSLTSGSVQLGDNVSTILDFLGIRHSKTYKKSKLSKTIFTQISIFNKIDIDKIGGEKVLNFDAKDRCTQYIHNEGVLVPIKKIKRERFKGNVYNIEVDDVNKYVVSGILVNNCRWYGGFQSYITATEFDCPIFVPSSHCKRPGEEQIPGLKHLSWVMWDEWMIQLSSFKFAVNLMPTVAAGTFSLNCGYWGIPCIGNEKVDTQQCLFPELCVDVNDIHAARHLAIQLKNKEFYEHVSYYAKTKAINSWHTNIEKWRAYIESTINE
jgi:hypothetical protein